MSDYNRQMKDPEDLEEDIKEVDDTHGLFYDAFDICAICQNHIIPGDDKEDWTITCDNGCHVFHYSCFVGWVDSHSLPIG